MFETNRQRLMIIACIERHPSAWEDFLDDYLPLLHQVVCEVESQMRFQESPDGVLREEILAGVLTGLIEKDLSLLRYYRAESGLDGRRRRVGRVSTIRPTARRSGIAREPGVVGELGGDSSGGADEGVTSWIRWGCIDG